MAIIIIAVAGGGGLLLICGVLLFRLCKGRRAAAATTTPVPVRLKPIALDGDVEAGRRIPETTVFSGGQAQGKLSHARKAEAAPAALAPPQQQSARAGSDAEEALALRRSLQAFAAGGACAHCGGRLAVRRVADSEALYVRCADCRTKAVPPPASGSGGSNSSAAPKRSGVAPASAAAARPRGPC
jgi:hypothetical protein